MEALKQSLKIGAALGVVVAVGLAVIPEEPTLLAGNLGLQSGSPAVEAMAPPPPASEAPRRVQADERPVQVAQTGSSGEAEDGLTPGQRHLQRLRGTSAPTSQAPAAAPPAEEPAAPADEPAVPAEEPNAQMERAPSSAGGGQGLDSLTQPRGRPEFRMFRTAEPSDSGTIVADGRTIRLAGLVPVPADARCADGQPCGEEAREAVRSWLAGREILCAMPQGAGGPAPAPCVRGEEDVGEWIVANGWAEAEPGSVYVEAEEAARAAGLGIWASGGR